MELNNNANQVTFSIENLIESLQEEMCQQEKDFIITYKNKTYSIMNAIDKEETIAQESLRRKVAIILVEKCIRLLFIRLKKNDLALNDIWDDVLCFTQGADLDDHKFEKYEEIAVDQFDQNGEKVTSIPLDFDSYQVKNDLGFYDDQENKDLVI